MCTGRRALLLAIGETLLYLQCNFLNFVETSVEPLVLHCFVVLLRHGFDGDLQEPEEFLEHSSEEAIGVHNNQLGQSVRDKESYKRLHGDSLRVKPVPRGVVSANPDMQLIMVSIFRFPSCFHRLQWCQLPREKHL